MIWPGLRRTVAEQDTAAPALEFLIPFYGDEGYLRDAVKSVITQTDSEWTLTIVEDGDHGPGVGRWLRGLEDPRIRHLRNERTLGVAANFQRCLDASSRDYVTFLGSDDRLRSTYVETVRQGLLTTPTVTMVHPGVQVIDEAGRPATPLADRLKARLRPRPPRGNVLYGERLFASLMLGNWTYFPSIAWRRESLARVGFRQDLDVALDLVALAALVLDGASMLLMTDVVFEYRRHVGSVSSLAATSAGRFIEERRVMGELAAHARERGWHRGSRSARVRVSSRAHAVALLPAAIRSRSWSPAGKYIRHAFGS